MKLEKSGPRGSTIKKSKKKATIAKIIIGSPEKIIGGPTVY
jgi:hypothetical protein